MKISKKHPSRKSHNWLFFDINDSFLQKSASVCSGTLYDLGAGESPYKDFFLQYVDDYIAVDWSSSPHKTRADINADLNSPLPIESDAADCVVSLSVMEHLCEPQTMLNEVHRILKPGGALVLQVPWQWWIHEAPHDYFRYTPYGLRYLCGKAGFTNILITPQTGFFTTWVLKFNYFSRRFVAGPKNKRLVLQILLWPIWTLGQIISPLLDRIDRDWSLETCGYWVTARKEKS